MYGSPRIDQLTVAEAKARKTRWNNKLAAALTQVL